MSHMEFEIAADPAASFETADLEVRIGSESAHTSIAIEPAGTPELRAPARLAGIPGVPVHFTVSAADGTGSGVSLSTTGLPRGAVFDRETGTFDWTPGNDDLGSYDVVFTATNSLGAATSKQVNLLVGAGLPIVNTVSACSPGAVAAIRGNWLFAGAVPLADPSGNSNELGGTRVSVNGDYAPILYASADRIDLLCPDGTPGSSLSIAVETAAGRSQVRESSMQSFTPALLTAAAGIGQALAVRSGTSELAAIPNERTSGNPVLAGDTLAFQATGIPCSMDSLYSMSMQMGLDVLPIGSLTPVSGHAGVCQVEVVVPPSAAGGSVPVVLRVPGGDGVQVVSNQATIGVAVR